MCVCTAVMIAAEGGGTGRGGEACGEARGEARGGRVR